MPTKFRGGIAADNPGPLGGSLVVGGAPVVISAEALATGGAVTTISNGLPAWHRVEFVVVKFADIAGSDATGATIAIGGTTVKTGVSLDSTGDVMWAPATPIANTGAASDIVVTLTGGSDQTPSAGTVSMDIYCTRYDLSV